MKNHKQILSMLSIVIGGVLSHGLSLMSSVDRGDNDGHSGMIRSQPVPSTRNPSIVKRKRVRKRFHRLRNHAEKKVVSLRGISESSKAPSSSSPTSSYSGAYQKPASQKRHKLIESSRRNGRGPRVIDISYTDTTRSTNMNTKTNTIYKSYRETVKSKGFNSKGKGHGHGVHVPTSSSLFETCARTCSDRSSSKDYVSSHLSSKGKGKGYGNGKGKGKGHRSSRNGDENASAGKGGSINRLGIRGKGKGEGKGSSRVPRLQGSSTLTSKGNSKGLSSTTTNRLRSGKGKGKGTSTSTSTHIGKGLNHVHYENECCQKGISFLKLRMEGLGTSAGTLSFGNNPCRITSTNISQGKGGKGGKGRGEVAVASQPFVRFLNCNDPCLDSFESMNSCSNSSAVVYVENGSEICLARWDDGFEFESKLPLSITLTYKSNGDGDSGEEFFQMIHTSCSRPAYPPYVTEMSDLSNPSSCENSRVPFVPATATATATGDFVNPTIVFSDGFSPTFQRENKMFGDNVPLFNHRFASCGCECGEDEDDDEANDDFINLIPSSFTPPPPTISPTPTNSNSEKDCNDICEDWVSENCIIPADGLLPELSCSLQSLGGGRFLQDFTAARTIANMKRNLARDEAFRNEMADLLEILLEAGFFD